MSGRWPSLSELRRAVGWHRRLLAAGLAAAAVALGLTALSPAPPPSTRVVVARSDLSPGTRLRGSDLTTVALPPAAVPTGATAAGGGAALTGRILAAAVRRGEPITDVRLVGRALLRSLGNGGAVAAPVRIADAGAVALLRPGDTIDVLAATPPSGSAQQPAAADVVASGARVLTVPAATDSAAGADGALVLLAVRPELALSLARAAVGQQLSITLRPG